MKNTLEETLIKTSRYEELLNKLEEKLRVLGSFPKILIDNTESKCYENFRKVFNRRYDFRPAIIVLVETKEQVSTIVQFVNDHKTKIALTVRSGGHDHEAECSGTDTLLIDFSKMNAVKVFHNNKELNIKNLVTIGPGARFIDIKKKLDNVNLGIPHGSCASVGIAGFTMGGGWGPWTRKYGMACESLVAADVVLGDGEIIKVTHNDDPNSRDGKILWALRGGGGLSYGIVTKLYFKAFELPKVVYTFMLPINHTITIHLKGGVKQYRFEMTAVKAIEKWERLIACDNIPNLMGTNLKVQAEHLSKSETPNPDAYLKCSFNGTFAGTRKELEKFIETNFDKEMVQVMTIELLLYHKSDMEKEKEQNTINWPFDSWDRAVKSKNGITTYNLNYNEGQDFHHLMIGGSGPAPHKISSKVVSEKGWDEEDRKKLIMSLQSHLLPPKTDSNKDFGVDAFITLGAISGEFYANYNKYKDAIGSAMPYKKRPFIIQYQAWWNQFLNFENEEKKGDHKKEQFIENRMHSNRAQDWIETCRNTQIENTDGSFISFKDNSIPTETYFGENYDDLINVKLEQSQDHNLLFRTRKTII